MREDYFNKFKGKNATFIGIGRSNIPAMKLLLKYGASVTVCDRRSLETIGETAKELENMGIELKLGDSYLDDIKADVVFRTPGMPFYKKELCDLRERGIVVTSEMEVFFDVCPCKIIAVTGSDGKTTTTSIIATMLKKSNKTVHIGGNIGAPLLPKIADIKSDDFAVVELSSFQLISMRKSPDIAVVTNLSPNHLDIHKDMQEYIDAKKNIILHQNAFSKSVLNLDNDITRGFTDLVRGKNYSFSIKKQPYNGAFLDDENMMCMSINGEKLILFSADEIKIPGLHNIENYLAAISALWGIVSKEDMLYVAKNFGGVEHRIELVRILDGVTYYNDAIATSPTRVISGTLSLYDKKIIMIAGGYDKNIPFDELGEVIPQKVKLLILMGNTADKIETAVKSSSNYKASGINIKRVTSMEEAVKVAKENALTGDIVSMAPACASFDMYKDFEAKGNHFKDIVNNL